MTEPLGFAQAAARARVAAAALAQGRTLDSLSMALAVLGLATLLWLSMGALPGGVLLLSVLAGAAQKVYALRVAFDALLFQHWSEEWRHAAAEGRDPARLATDLAALDDALAVCAMRARGEGRVRGLDSRLCGARALLGRQALFFAIQLGAMIAAAMLASAPA